MLNLSTKLQIDDKNKQVTNCLYNRGAYIIKLSHSTDLLAIAANQKYVKHTCLVFMSPSNGTLFPVDLRNFGLNSEARGRYKFNLNLVKII